MQRAESAPENFESRVELMSEFLWFVQFRRFSCITNFPVWANFSVDAKRHANAPGFPKKACKRAKVSKRDMLAYQGFQKGFPQKASKRTRVSEGDMQTQQGFQKRHANAQGFQNGTCSRTKVSKNARANVPGF